MIGIKKEPRYNQTEIYCNVKWIMIKGVFSTNLSIDDYDLFLTLPTHQ
jgi:hypothetical protein